MKQFALLLVFLFPTLSDGFFFDWFKPKKTQTYVYPAAPSYGYSYYRPSQQQPYRVPVWQAMPSGYPAKPTYSPPHNTYQTGSYSDGGGYYGNNNNYGAGSYGYQAGSGYESYGGGGGISYSSPTYPSSSYDSGYIPVYEVNPPSSYASGVGGSTGNTDYTGSDPLLSVPVYFPKGATGYSTYSNGVSGYYDANVAASNVVDPLGTS